jgi:hypothetical protein
MTDAVDPDLQWQAEQAAKPVPKDAWKSLAIALGCAGLVLLVESGWLRDGWLWALDWTREAGNAGAVQATAVVAQVAFAAILSWLTYHATRTARQIADASREQAEREASRARADAEREPHETRRLAARATLPVITFRRVAYHSAITKLDVLVENSGIGPALMVDVGFRRRYAAIDLDDSSAPFHLAPGAVRELHLATRASVGAAPPALPPDEDGRVLFAQLMATYMDVQERQLLATIELWRSAGDPALVLRTPRHIS